MDGITEKAFRHLVVFWTKKYEMEWHLFNQLFQENKFSNLDLRKVQQCTKIYPLTFIINKTSMFQNILLA